MQPFFVLALVSFVLHLVWERAHIHLYTGYDTMRGVLPVFLHATLGDVLYTVGAALFVSLVIGDFSWLVQPKLHHYAALALLGLGIAIFVEYKAMALGKWEYTRAMPRIGRLGLSPLVQMTVLLPLSVCCTVALVPVLLQ